MNIIHCLAQKWPFVRGRHFLFRKLESNGKLKKSLEDLKSPFSCRHGFEMFGIQKDRVSDWLKLFGNYEVGTDKYFLSRSLGAEQLFLDIGANVGYYSMLLSHANPQAHVWAFEPNPLPRECLDKSISFAKLSDRVTVYPFGLSDSDREENLVFEQGVSGSGHISPDSEVGVEIQLRSFQSLWESQNKPSVGLVKIDVEGHEWQVLATMKEMLQRDHPDLVIELVDEQLKRFGSSSQEITAFLEGMGYQNVGGFELNTFFEHRSR